MIHQYSTYSQSANIGGQEDFRQIVNFLVSMTFKNFQAKFSWSRWSRGHHTPLQTKQSAVQTQAEKILFSQVNFSHSHWFEPRLRDFFLLLQLPLQSLIQILTRELFYSGIYNNTPMSKDHQRTKMQIQEKSMSQYFFLSNLYHYFDSDLLP